MAIVGSTLGCWPVTGAMESGAQTTAINASNDAPDAGGWAKTTVPIGRFFTLYFGGMKKVAGQ